MRELATVLVYILFSSAIANAASYTAHEEANVALVRDFFDALHNMDMSGDRVEQVRAIANKYVRRDYIDHSRDDAAGKGRDGLVEAISSAATSERTTSQPSKTFAVMAEGDKVLIVNTRAVAGGSATSAPSAVFIFNLFRIQDGQLAEHWDAMQIQTLVDGAQ